MFKSDNEVLDVIIQDLSILVFLPESMIIKQGTEGLMLYFVAVGECAVFVTNEKKKELQVNVVKEGDYFGEVALIKSCPRTATVKTLNYSTCAGYQKAAFDRFCLQHPEIKRSMENKIK